MFFPPSIVDVSYKGIGGEVEPRCDPPPFIITPPSNLLPRHAIRLPTNDIASIVGWRMVFLKHLTQFR